ncbi:MAG: pilin [Patescibacteria group bacterium]|nr:pilin [Patescibacteria group bacterium]
MRKKLSCLLFSLLAWGILFLVFPAAAQTPPAATPAPASNPLSITNPQMKAFLPASGISVTSVAGITGAIITAVLGLLGVIFIALLIYAGFQWMTAEGNEEKIDKAKQTITRAIIGLVIVIAAYSITYFVFNALNTGAGQGIHTVGGSG